jgi:beta-glucosidase/6-phospho-beta-glucosidase/beta-galactosidase
MPSSVVANMIYDAASAVLSIVYVSGAVYAYEQVPKNVYAAMKAATSKGIFLNKHIKGKYPFRKVR